VIVEASPPRSLGTFKVASPATVCSSERMSFRFSPFIPLHGWSDSASNLALKVRMDNYPYPWCDTFTFDNCQASEAPNLSAGSHRRTINPGIYSIGPST